MKRTTVFLLTASVLLLHWAPVSAKPGREEFLRIASSGWVFELREKRFRQPKDEPPAVFNSRELVAGGLCLFGAPPHPVSHTTVAVFADLIGDVFGQDMPVRYEAGGITDCPADRHIFFRLYQDRPPLEDFNRDLQHLDAMFGIGFPSHPQEPFMTPGQGNGFFGRNGTSVHVMVKQPVAQIPTLTGLAFYRSVMIEELYQALTFGMDIPKFDRETPFYSKLEEYPIYVGNLAWESERYMQSVVAGNPGGLCLFDVFMLHALAGTNVATTNSQKFLDFIDADFDALLALAGQTLSNRKYDAVLDRDCGEIPD